MRKDINKIMEHGGTKLCTENRTTPSPSQKYTSSPRSASGSWLTAITSGFDTVASVCGDMWRRSFPRSSGLAVITQNVNCVRLPTALSPAPLRSMPEGKKISEQKWHKIGKIRAKDRGQ